VSGHRCHPRPTVLLRPPATANHSALASAMPRMTCSRVIGAHNGVHRAMCTQLVPTSQDLPARTTFLRRASCPRQPLHPHFSSGKPPPSCMPLLPIVPSLFGSLTPSPSSCVGPKEPPCLRKAHGANTITVLHRAPPPFPPPR
jgi:hypothetical protein